MSTRQRIRDRVAEFLRARPNQWLPHRRFFSVGGECAWRTRISDCRLELGMEIPNKVVYVRRRRAEGAKVVVEVVRKISFYKFVPAPPAFVDARGQVWLWPREEAAR